MIDLKELRLGNLVADPICHIVTTHCINCPDTYYYLCSPIPLTPEILEKAGFEKEITTGKSWANDGDEIVSYKNKKGNMRIQDNLVFYSISTRLELIKNDLKHLHQLQNLYFALTGTELEINL